MYGIKAGPLVMATVGVVFVLYAVLFFAQGRALLGLSVLAGAAGCAAYVIGVYVRAAATRRAKALERERAFLERVRRG
jgi:hypothetical protein